jgi:tetratricopeptide (TPR) repeat protein
MKLRILLVVALLTTIGSACSSAVNSEYLKQAQADALSRVAVKYAQVGQKDKAEQLLTQALQSAKAIESFDTKNIALSDVASKYAEAGQSTKPLRLQKTINSREGDGSRNNALEKVAIQYAQAGQYDKAIQTTKAIKDGYARDIPIG